MKTLYVGYRKEIEDTIDNVQTGRQSGNLEMALESQATFKTAIGNRVVVLLNFKCINGNFFYKKLDDFIAFMLTDLQGEMPDIGYNLEFQQLLIDTPNAKMFDVKKLVINTIYSTNINGLNEVGKFDILGFQKPIVMSSLKENRIPMTTSGVPFRDHETIVITSPNDIEVVRKQ